MKQYSPARPIQPLMRKAGAERGSAQFEPVSWGVAFAMLEKCVAHLRATNPKKFALFTGRDRMQAGGRFIAINPICTGYAAIADEWERIRRGADGALFMALIRELIERCRGQTEMSGF
jgi:anaerobic selenocysteine-containing dehydrogenase